jgi:glycosyltransferase involved in cell wall biosynthesis
MGKTREAEAAAAGLRAAGELVSSIQLGRRTEPTRTLLDLLDSDAGAAWRSGERSWHIFLDGIDEADQGAVGVEAPLRAFLEALVASGGPLPKLRIRLLCRTVEWAPALDRVLNLIWPDTEVRKLQIAPLSEGDVRQAVDIVMGDTQQADRFLEAARRSHVEALTERPVSLRFLTELFREQDDLPLGQSELYRQGLQALLEEHDSTAPTRVRRGPSDVSEKLTVAARIAAVTMFSGLTQIWAGATGSAPAGAFELSDVAGGSERGSTYSFPVSEEDLLEILRTALFVAVAPDVYGWAHQTFAEYLAARYLLEHGLNAGEVFKLLSVDEPVEGGGVAPQLREVAAWIATDSQEMFEHLLGAEPDILLQSDVAAADPDQRERLVAALLARLNRGELVEAYFGLTHLFGRLAHDGLAGQLRAFIEDPANSEFARRAAIDIVEANQLGELASPLAVIALSAAEPVVLRKDAAHAVAKLGDARAKAALVGVLAQDLRADADDELKGAVLTAVWPDHLDVTSLLKVLAPRRRSNLFGVYSLFERQLAFGELSASDALAAIEWLRTRVSVEVQDFSWRGVLSKVFWAAATRLDDAAVRESLARFIAELLESAASWIYDGDPADTDDGGTPSWGGVPADRLSLVRLLLRDATDPVHMARLAPHFVARLVEPKDLGAYLAALQQEADEGQQQALVELILGLTRQIPMDDLGPVWDLAEKHDVLRRGLEAAYFIPFDSQAATWMRDSFRRAQERESRQARTSEAAARANSGARGLLDEIEAGDAEAWWRLNLQLFVSDAGRYEAEYEFRSDLTATPGWARLSGRDRARVINTAEVYLRDAKLTTLRWLGTNSQHRPAAAAVRAFRLLSEERPEVVAALQPEVWARWAPALISFFDNDGNAASSALAPLATQAYSKAPEAVMRALARLALGPRSEGLADRPLHLLESAADQRLLAFLDRIRRRPGRKTAREPHLYAFLVRRGGDETTNALLDALADPEPAEALAAEGPLPEGVRATAELMRDGVQEAWDALLALRPRDPKLARAIWSALAELIGFQPSGPMLNRPETTLKQAYLDLEALFPERPDDEDGARTLSAADYVERLRSGIIGQLVARGTEAAVLALEAIAAALPQASWLSWRLQQARRNFRAVARPLHAPSEIIATIGAYRRPLPRRDDVQAAQAAPRAPSRRDESESVPSGPEGPALPNAAASADRLRATQRRLRILAVATEWSSAHGGVSTLNRELCVGLAALGHDVRCVAIDPTAADTEDAETLGIKLIGCPTGLYIPGDQRLLLVRSRHLDGFTPDVVVGHDHVTGPEALLLAEDLGAAYAHMLHTVPEEAEILKGRSAGPGRALLRGDDKANEQIALSRAARLVLAVGPKIHDSIALRMTSPSKVVEIIPGLNSELLSHSPETARLPRSYGLMSARMEDADLKGAKLACESFRDAGLAREWPAGARPHLILRGFSDQATEEFEQAVGPRDGFSEWVLTRAYTQCVAEIQDDIRTASVVLMPSRTEGFGLAGLEAIAAGVPVIISLESGLAEYLARAVQRGEVPQELVDGCILAVVGDPGTVRSKWAEQVGAVLRDRDAAFQRARALRDALTPVLNWRAAAEAFSAAVVIMLEGGAAT